MNARQDALQSREIGVGELLAEVDSSDPRLRRSATRAEVFGATAMLRKQVEDVLNQMGDQIRERLEKIEAELQVPRTRAAVDRLMGEE